MRREGDRGSQSAARLEWRVGAREPREGFEHGGSQGLRCGPVRLGAFWGRGCRSGAAPGRRRLEESARGASGPWDPPSPSPQAFGRGFSVAVGAEHSRQGLLTQVPASAGAGLTRDAAGVAAREGWGSGRGGSRERLRGRVRGGPGPGGVATRDAASGRRAEIPAPEPAPGGWGAGTVGGQGTWAGCEGTSLHSGPFYGPHKYDQSLETQSVSDEFRRLCSAGFGHTRPHLPNPRVPQPRCAGASTGPSRAEGWAGHSPAQGP